MAPMRETRGSDPGSPQVVVLEDAQGQVLRSPEPQVHGPSLLSLRQTQRVALRWYLADPGLGIEGAHLLLDEGTLAAAGQQGDPGGVPRQLQGEGFRYRDGVQEALHPRQAVIAGALRRDGDQPLFRTGLVSQDFPDDASSHVFSSLGPGPVSGARQPIPDARSRPVDCVGFGLAVNRTFPLLNNAPAMTVGQDEREFTGAHASRLLPLRRFQGPARDLAAGDWRLSPIFAHPVPKCQCTIGERPFSLALACT